MQYMKKQIRNALYPFYSACMVAPAPNGEEYTYVFPLSYSQRRLWFAHQLKARLRGLQYAAELRLAGKLDTAALRASFSELSGGTRLCGQPSLYATENGQEIHRSASVSLSVVDLTTVRPEVREEVATGIRQDEWQGLLTWNRTVARLRLPAA